MSAALTPTGGEFRVALALSDGQVQAVTCTSTRPESLTGVFQGHDPDSVARSIGSVFSLCGKAQTIAALSACEAALGVQPAPAQLVGRQVLRQAEMVTQAALRLCLDWPPRLGLTPDPAVVRGCLKAEQDLENLLLGPDWRRVGGADHAYDFPAASAALADLAESLLPLTGPDGLGVALWQALDLRCLLGLGPLPAGSAPEQGAFERCWDAVADTRLAHGPALGARLAAALADLEAVQQDMAATLLRGDASGFATPGTAPETGVAQVETLRGLLNHEVTLADGKIARYTITAPTETNFRPGGPLESGLLGASAKDRKVLQLAAELHVLAIDPCVDFRVDLRDA